MKQAEFKQEYERFLAGEMLPAERQAFEEAVLADPEWSAEVYADQNIIEAVQGAAAARAVGHRLPGSESKSWWRWTAPLAAAAVLVLAVWVMKPSPVTEPVTPVMRAGSSGLVVIEPAGDLAAVPTHFVWRTVEGASKYRFELMDEEARVLLRAVVGDTTLVAAEIEGGVPRRGAWRVVALNEVGQELASSTATGFVVLE